MKIPIYHVDAFASRLFEGNAAAVCPLDFWPDDKLLQNIAMENNLSETAFYVEKDGCWEIRWFTVASEVELCGHATLAAAHILFNHYGRREKELRFITRERGELIVTKNDNFLTLNFPVDDIHPSLPPDGLIEAFGKKPKEIWKGKTDYLLYYTAQEDIESISPDFSLLSKVDARGVIVTAPGYESDFVSRFFAPAIGIDEDPVTGSAHTSLAPFWAKRLGKNEFKAIQLSKRGGYLKCNLSGDRILISGEAITYMEGEIYL
jgi:PhzF family phenazine biosynthesis protein